jgi:NAD(P)-dependent dehydrogenase (short-subunit alcohol dehydrogenase family)
MTKIWTASAIGDLTGKTVVITGANSGIGFQTARQVARRGAHTVLACRNLRSAEMAANSIKRSYPDSTVDSIELDLASMESVYKCAGEIKSGFEQLDVLVNNAGIMMCPYATTQDGFELQLGTNHLGHFALTGLLIDLLTKTPKSRVVNLSSTMHRFGTMDLSDLMFDGGNGYTPIRAYGRSKLAALLFTYELQRRFERNGIDSYAVAAHPGYAQTNLTHYIDKNNVAGFFRPILNVFAQPAAMGALPTLRAAFDQDVAGGEFFGPKDFFEQRGYPIKVTSSKESYDCNTADQLWKMSEELTGVHFL